jgi:hypothetical protein
LQFSSLALFANLGYKLRIDTDPHKGMREKPVKLLGIMRDCQPFGNFGSYLFILSRTHYAEFCSYVEGYGASM